MGALLTVAVAVVTHYSESAEHEKLRAVAEQLDAILDYHMQAIEDEPDELVATRVRYFRALRKLRHINQHTIKSLESILKDHINFPNSICNHAVDDLEPLDREKTIVSLVIDLNSRLMHVAWGNPCLNSYNIYHLDA